MIQTQILKFFTPHFYTVDPSRDFRKFQQCFCWSTGTEVEIKVIKDYKIYVNLKKDEHDRAYLVDHSSLIFLSDEF